jgi:exopolyphosphatase/guanosine-5'-triphosphate,3'-diphosphate pyrophosphatase
VRSTEIFNAAAELGGSYGFETDHARQVSKLALRLFDQLQPLHGMGNTERIWLRAAAMLHDVAKTQNGKRHHKLARDIIIKASDLPFRREERVIIGLVARYHRGSLPREDHKYFADLDRDARLYVRKLGALLRLADGLDKGHSELLEGLRCEVGRGNVLLRVLSRDVLNIGVISAKADLFEQIFRKKISVHVSVGRPGFSAALDFDGSPAYAYTN